MSATNRQLDALAEFYLRQSEGNQNLFEIWEEGAARGDSVTPSTYSTEYRRWMRDKLISELKRCRGSDLLSLGCGNAAVEAEIARKGYRVLGVDALEEAVALAKAKGVEAVCGDISRWSPDHSWPVIYMDGVLGHLYDPQTGLRNVLARVRSWLAPGGDASIATLVASNDSTRNGAPTQPAPGVDGFHWLSADYMRGQALAVGFDDAATEEVHYNRPLSGNRVRAIIVAHIGSRR